MIDSPEDLLAMQEAKVVAREYVMRIQNGDVDGLEAELQEICRSV